MVEIIWCGDDYCICKFGLFKNVFLGYEVLVIVDVMLIGEVVVMNFNWFCYVNNV